MIEMCVAAVHAWDIHCQRAAVIYVVVISSPIRRMLCDWRLPPN